MRISDWSSYVSSSDLFGEHARDGLEEEITRFVEDQPLLVAHEHRPSGEAFQIGDLAADRALRPPHFIGGLGDVAQSCDRFERLERGQLGRAAWRERVWRYVNILGVAV